jgi:hypothetical protein
MIEAKLVVDLKGGLPNWVKAKNKNIKRFEKGEIYLLPDKYDFSNNYFEILDKKVGVKKDVKRNRN